MSGLSKALVLAALSTLPLSLLAADTPAEDQKIINAKEIQWGDAPPSLPKGAKIAVLHGDPGKEGPFTLRLKVPAGYKIPPHWHTQNENLTVISGTFYLGMGDKADPKQAKALGAGGFHFLPGKVHHYAFAKAPAVVQVTGTGPFDINYINPADNPEKK